MIIVSTPDERLPIFIDDERFVKKYGSGFRGKHFSPASSENHIVQEWFCSG